MGRPPIHGVPGAGKNAHRAVKRRLDLMLTPELHATLQKISDDIDQPMQALVLSMIKFALTNHDYGRFGLTHQKKG